MILSIGITSYNRVSELDRCLKSIKTKYKDEIEIIVSEDKSPKRELIREVVSRFQESTEYKVVFNTNQDNLGYDRNLKKLIELASGKYILYMSDDDALIDGMLDKLIDKLLELNVGVVYSGFAQGENDYRRYYKTSFFIPSGEEYAKKHIEDSILFSGLVFNVEVVKKLKAEEFLNKNYFQVYMFLYALYKYGGYYVSLPLVNAVGDGENGFGISDSSEKNELLANRNSVFSMLEFHKGLFWVIKKFDKDFNKNFFKEYQKEYNLRSISGMAIARKNSLRDLKTYWEKMKELDYSVNIISKAYYIMLYVLGTDITMFLLRTPHIILKKVRKEN